MTPCSDCPGAFHYLPAEGTPGGGKSRSGHRVKQCAARPEEVVNVGAMKGPPGEQNNKRKRRDHEFKTHLPLEEIQQDPGDLSKGNRSVPEKRNRIPGLSGRL
ncbi:hypothetical cytosolic protein [Syntrophus aciditrophicus SB]|uniref:Hypothetical cytosolic protein n=1 Tax=Syntrophus aciditrophicus (strain SB) TaxID=56780 RepID=Q2LY03_SYNAS|nr:hypothetical cytosolic protein [Syntrophus aciditrophicus SB]